MSFLDIVDPKKRNEAFKELERLKKGIYQDAVNEKLGFNDLQYDLGNLYKPIIDSQSGIKENLAKLENKADLAITLSNYPAIMDVPESKIVSLGTIATNYLKSAYSNKKEADFTFGIHSKDGKFPDKDIYNEDDLENYKNILKETDAISSSKYPGKPRSSRSEKYNKIIKPIWVEIARKSGKGVIILPSDPNELVKMLALRIAAFEAGNTGARNEAVAICDELLRQGEIDSENYKSLQNIFRLNKNSK
ncbi:uncharacterized protein LOC136093697 [Hydra vulgaris]|uniref:uncharacterized protein LOC136093697 n=1 Tax=Hydra vulgaris TaxID=6087 RepID=UPI0032E9C7CD